MTAVRTLGQFLEEEQILAQLGEMIADIARAAGRGAKTAGKLKQLAVSCTHCKATKTCCWSVAIARLYEGMVVAGELRRTGRDTPALREQLAERAAAMEAARPQEWRAPCVFLDERERCTVYAARPTACATLFVYTDPAWCTTRAGDIQGYVAAEEGGAATALEDVFRERIGLRKKVGRRYIGVLPRMVLVALEAWDRTDFRDYLRQLPWPSDDELAKYAPPS